MLRALRRRHAQGVVIHKIDRSARNLKDWADLGDLIDQGLEVHFANESLDLNSRGGRLSADIQAVVAADYIRNLREETKKGIYGRLKQGFYPFRAPIGYVDNGSGKPKTIDPVRGPMVKEIFTLYATAQWTIPALIEEMYRRGLRNLAGGKVSKNGLVTILHNPFYVGVIRIYRTGEHYQGNHEPLISKRMFDDVQDIATGRLNTRSQKNAFLFRRFVKCASCKHSLIGERQKGNVYYRCHGISCPTTCVREDAVNAKVEAELQKLQFTEREKNYLLAHIAELKADWVKQREAHLQAMKITIVQMTERLNRLADAYLDQALDRAMYEERKAALLMERQAVEEAKRAYETNQRSLPDELQHYIELASDAFSVYREALDEQRRRLMMTLTSNLCVSQKKLDYTYASPFREIAEREKDADGRPSTEMRLTLNKLLDKIALAMLNSPEPHSIKN